MEYINLINLSGNKKQTLGGAPYTLCNTILLYFILSLAIVANEVHFA